MLSTFWLLLARKPIRAVAVICFAAVLAWGSLTHWRLRACQHEATATGQQLALLLQASASLVAAREEEAARDARRARQISQQTHTATRALARAGDDWRGSRVVLLGLLADLQAGDGAHPAPSHDPAALALNPRD